MTDPIGDDISKRLLSYVYSLIDPRDGSTFYVGKGKGGRVLDHVRNALKTTEDEDAHDLKVKKIREITDQGSSVTHFIHRHGLTETEAELVEAVLIDTYPDLTNKQGGHGSKQFGPQTFDDLVTLYRAEEFEVRHKILLISIAHSIMSHPDIYENVRAAWRIDVKRAERDGELILAHVRGIVKGVYIADGGWVEAKKDVFPNLDSDVEGRWGFIGTKAAPEVWEQYVGKRVPTGVRQRGAASPIRYLSPFAVDK